MYSVNPPDDDRKHDEPGGVRPTPSQEGYDLLPDDESRVPWFATTPALGAAEKAHASSPRVSKTREKLSANHICFLSIAAATQTRIRISIEKAIGGGRND